METEKIIEPYRPEIRFADIDAMGHVNNAVFLSYFEQARISFFAQLLGLKWDWKRQGILVVRNEINYKSPVYLRDEIAIHVGCGPVGNKSFTLHYRVKREEELCADGLSVLVCFDHNSGKTTSVPELWREHFALLRANQAQ